MTGAPDTPPLAQIVEGLLFASSEPLAAEKLAEAAEAPDAEAVRAAIEELKAHYAATGRAFAIQEVAGGVLLVTRPEMAPWVQRLRKRKDAKLSPAALETLAIVAYKQPISRAEIESIRGVQAGPILHALMERDLIRVAGKSDALGHPLLYGTTQAFLVAFGLKALDELPSMQEFTQRASGA